MDEQERYKQIDIFLRETVDRLRVANGQRPALIPVIEQFLDRGMEIIWSPSALWDHFGSLLRKAGYNERDRDRITRIFSTVTNQRFRGGRPYPPNWPWLEEDPSAPPNE